MNMNDSDRIYLKPISIEDTDLILKWRNDENVKKYFIYQNTISREDHLNWLNTKVKSGEVIQFIILEKTSNRAIGSVYLRDIDLDNKKAEYGIFIGESDARGKGYGTEIAKIMLRYAFENEKLHRVYLRVYADNLRAIKSYENAGFHLEGILKEDVFVCDRYRDIVWMAAINPEGN